MGMREEFFELLKPIADNYSNPRYAAAGVIGLANPGLGMALRYGPEIISMMQGASQAGGGEGVGSRGASMGGMSGMMPSSVAGSPRGGVGGKTGLPLSDLSQYFQRGRTLDDSMMRQDMPMMNQGGLAQADPSPSQSKNLLNTTQGAPMTSSPISGLLQKIQELKNNPSLITSENPSQSFGRQQTPVTSGPISDLFQKIQELRNNPPLYTSENPPQSFGFFGRQETPVTSGGFLGGMNIDQSQIERIKEMIRQRQQQMAQPASQQPQMDPAAIQARLDAFLANNPDRASVSLPFGGGIDIANLRDRMARMSTLMGRGMTTQEAMGNQRAAIAQGHDLNNDGIVTDAEYRQATMPMQNFDVNVRQPGAMIADNTRMNVPVMGPMANVRPPPPMIVDNPRINFPSMGPMGAGAI